MYNSYIVKDRIKNMNSYLKNFFENTVKLDLIKADKSQEDLEVENRKNIFTYGIFISDSKRSIQTIDANEKKVTKNITLS